jgi:hypothetical protein
VEKVRLLLLQVQLASISLCVDALVEEGNIRCFTCIIHAPRDEVVELLCANQLLVGQRNGVGELRD